MARRPLEDAERIEVASLTDLRDWLDRHHGRETGVWLVTWKKADALRHVATADVVDELMCFGWVDSLPRRLDDARSMLWISPRKPGSNWSRVNRDKVARLEAAGRMAASGCRAVSRARADGTWTALDDVENLVVPPDLAAALSGTPICAPSGMGGPARSGGERSRSCSTRNAPRPAPPGSPPSSIAPPPESARFSGDRRRNDRLSRLCYPISAPFQGLESPSPKC